MKNAFTAALLILLLVAVVALFQFSENGRYALQHDDGRQYVLDTRSGVVFMPVSKCIPITPEPQATARTEKPRSEPTEWEDLLEQIEQRPAVKWLPCSGALDLKTGAMRLLPLSVDRTRMPLPAKAGAVNP